MPTDTLDCWYLTGPTAGGKTQVGLELAGLIGAEIISLDSMALYRGMDIGTAKPTVDQQARVPHHLIDILEVDEEYSLSEYVDAAAVQIDEIRSRGREVLFVGGTPLYLKALLRGIFQGPPADWEFRKQVKEEVARVGTQPLHDRLMQVDPLSAARLHPNDVRRIIRALEVYKLTGRPISHMQTQFDEGRPADQCKVFVLDRPREILLRRIDQRVDGMIAEGLVDEVRKLMDRFPRFSRTASQAVGYREMMEHLRGHREFEDTVDLIKTRTRQFAKRQETWFRGLSECRRVPQQEGTDPADVARQIVALVEE